jgi:hypothetical protein
MAKEVTMDEPSVRLLHRCFRAAGQGLLVAILLVGLLPTTLLSTPGGAPGPAEVASPGAWVQLPEDDPWAPVPPVATSSDFQPPTGLPTAPTKRLDSAYVRQVDLGDGQYQALVSTTPINYQADDGSWQPIDPRFAAIPGGFLNRTNSLVIGAAGRQATLRLGLGESVVGWEAQALVLTTADGQETVLARTLDTAQALSGTLGADGLTIRYAGSWSLPTLSEEVTAGPGQVEQRLVLSEQPSAQEGEWLTLQALLHLLPGSQVYANGQVQETAFVTAGAVEIRDAQGGTPLVLVLPRALEQARPDAGVAGRYRLTPLTEGLWQVAVDTPWSWWTDPQRVYPLVLDPHMQIKRPTEVAEVYSEWLCAWDPTPGDYNVPAVSVGCRPECPGAFRTLLRFGNLPTLPPGYQVEKAELLVAPVRGYYPPIPGSGMTWWATVETDVHRVLGAWDPSTVYWTNYPPVDPNPLDEAQVLAVTPPWMCAQSGSSPIYWVSRWTLQDGPAGIVSDWLQGIDNYGLDLRAADETHCRIPPFDRDQFVQIPKAADWRDDDMALPPDWLILSHGGGFMLLITYTPPTLQNGVPYDYVHLPDLPSGGDDYARTMHAYNLPASSSPWTAVAVKGLQRVTTPTDTLFLAAGNLAIDQVCGGGWTCGQILSSGDFAAEPNYVVIRGDPSARSEMARVHPPDPNAAANADLTHYVVESSSSVPLVAGNPPIVPFDVYTTTFVMSSTEILRVFDLNLVDNSRVKVELDVDPGGLKVGARLYHPVASGQTLPKDSSQARKLPDMFEVGSGDGGTWALVLEYQDDVTPERYSTNPISYTVNIVVRACPLNSIPIPGSCRCQVVQQPDGGTPYHDVGPYRVYSQDGFEQSPSGEWSTVLGAGCNTPMIGWASGGTNYLTAVAQGPIRFYEPQPLSLSGSSNSLVWLAGFGPSPPDLVQLWNGYFLGYPNAGDPDYGDLVPNGLYEYAGTAIPLDKTDAVNAALRVDVFWQSGNGSATITRDVETSPGATGTFTFGLTWFVFASADPIVGPSVSNQSGPSQAEVGSLTLLFGSTWAMDMDTLSYPPPGRFSNLRSLGKVVQPPELGGAWREVQSLILPQGKGLPGPGGGSLPCLRYCLDLRSPDDTLAQPQRTWKMPDVDVSGAARTVIYDEPGQLAVFSSDHPEAVDDVGVPFSFRTFGGEVSVEKALCPASKTDPGSGGDEVIVIRGTTHIALPSMGSDLDPDKMIEAGFTLCQNKLRQVLLEFHGPSPGIPVGSTGFFVYGVSGQITVDPDYTEVNVNVDYQSGPEGGLTKGQAGVTMDTRGLFDLQAHGTVLEVVSYQGHAWVAWNPLDVGVDVTAWYSDWLSGQVHAHLWKGQGWQHQYSWLPNNDESHFAGSIDAAVHIGEGQAFSWWFIDIPPWNITFHIWVAFGQFCTNSGCSAYEWGVKGGFSVVGYDVGLYFGFSSGFDFILGSDGHVLVDQYAAVDAAETAEAGGAVVSAVPLVAGQPARFHRVAMPDPLAAEATWPITITDYTGSALVGLTWEDAGGSPELTLLRPDGQEINPANAASYGISTVATAAGRLYGLPNPMAGIWHAQISNAAPSDNYHLVFFANKEMPPVQLLTPAYEDEPWDPEDSVWISWSVPPTLPAGVDLRISLYYSVTESGALTPSQEYGGVIRENLPLSDGSYSWDVSYTGPGLYRVYARISDGQDGPYRPRPTRLGTDQVPDVEEVWAPGSLRMIDVNGPAVPTGLTLTSLDEALRACWDVSAAPDLSGYVLHYSVPDVYGVSQEHHLRVHATVPYSPTGNARQCARIGGLNAGTEVGVQIAAYDASGNLSAYSWPVLGPVSGGVPNYPPGPGVLSGSVGANHSAVLSWTGAQTPSLVAGYSLYYAPDYPAGPGQPGSGAVEGDSPLDVGNVLNTTLHGLEPGRMYHFRVQAYDGDGRTGPLSNDLPLWLTDGQDGDGDGLPDDWEAFYRLVNPSDDPDQDCLSNIEEYYAGTDPRRPDTDNDGFFDGEEIEAGSEPLDGHDIPGDLTGLFPRLRLFPDHLVFRTGTASGNPPSQIVQLYNEGGGDLGAAAAVSAGAPWLTAELQEDRLVVGVDNSGLVSGHYTATVTVSSLPGACILNSPQTVAVDLWLFEGRLRSYYVYLPLTVHSGP